MRLVICIAGLTLALVLSGCSGLAQIAGHGPSLGTALQAPAGKMVAEGSPQVLKTGSIAGSPRQAIIDMGQPAAPTADPQSTDPDLGDKVVELNFVETDVREFSRVLFSEVLKVPYLIDPNISGTVTVRSGGKIDGNRALALARQALESSGNAIRVSDGVFKVTSLAAATAASGNLKTFTLKYVDPGSAQAALQGLMQGGPQIVSTSASSLTIRGDAETLNLVASMITSIDVDRFRSASFGLFPLKFGAATDVASELQGVYVGIGVTNATILPIDRINSILVIAPKPEQLDFARKWLGRLDQGPQNQRQIYVYQVKNREADELAKLLQTIFAGSGQSMAPVVTQAGEGQSLTSPGAYLGPPTASDDGVKITADPAANKLVIWATSSEYDLVTQALARLDRPVSQVYVEATIAEVRLSGELSHGVRWFLQSNGLSAGYSDASNGAVASAFPGFNASLQVPQAELVISALESHTDVRIVATPQLTVVDHQEATIQVGDQVPVVTKSVQDASSGKAVIANDVSFRDTGVILKVTPQIRSSGEVLLDIAQEVSRVVPTTSSQIDSPTISQRKVASTVLVPNGMAIVLAGLISTSDESSQGGLPGTKGNFLENIFGSKKDTTSRSELIVIIRPVIVQDKDDLRSVAAEVAQKMQAVMQVPAN